MEMAHKRRSVLVDIKYRAETAGEDPRPDHGGYQYNPQ